MRKILFPMLAIAAAFAPASARAAAAAKPLGVILAAGDITGCEASDMAHAQQTASRLEQEIGLLRQDGVPVKVVILGDFAYDDGTAAEFTCFDKTWGVVLRRALAEPDMDLLPIPGNHEYRTDDAAPFFAYFKSNHWIASAAKDNRKGNYALTFPGAGADAWRLIGLNSELMAQDATAQMNWLQGEIAASSEPCVMSFWHRPVFSSGKHSHGESGKNSADAPAKQQRMADVEMLLARHGASLVLNGHDHNYEELAPHDEAGSPSAHGLRSFVVGTGGRKLRPEKYHTWTAISENFDTESYGILRLSLYPGKYAWSFLPASTGTAATYAGEGVCNPRLLIGQ